MFLLIPLKFAYLMNDGVQKNGGGGGQGDDTLQFDGRYKYYQFSIKLLNLFFSQKSVMSHQHSTVQK